MADDDSTPTSAYSNLSQTICTWEAEQFCENGFYVHKAKDVNEKASALKPW